MVEYHGNLIEITDAKKREALVRTGPLHRLLHVLFSVSEQNLLVSTHCDFLTLWVQERQTTGCPGPFLSL